MIKLNNFKCKNCRKLFQDSFQILQHENTHMGTRPFLCANCGTGFQTIETYVEHAKKFPANHYFPCQHCKFVFNEALEFSKHLCNKVIKRTKVAAPVSTPTGIPEALWKNLHQGGLLQKECDDSIENNLELAINFKDSNIKTEEKTKNKVAISTNELNKKYICKGCKKVFSTQKAFKVHKKTYPGAHNFICNDCSKSFTSKLKLIRHFCINVSNEPFQCSCLKKFNTNAEFREHVGTKPYLCCACNLDFTLLANLIRHTRTHTQQKPYQCKYCKRGFTQASNLRNHVYVHSGESLKCDLCSFSCQTRIGLFKHKKKHDRGMDGTDLRKKSFSTFKCDACGREFKFLRNLSMHMKIHAVTECLCTECGQMFSGRRAMKRHVMSKHGAQLRCPVCDKEFSSLSALNNHAKTHVTTKNFICHICNREFALQSYLTQHLKTHSDVKNFSCRDCGQKFKVAASLKYHNKFSCPSLTEKVNA